MNKENCIHRCICSVISSMMGAFVIFLNVLRSDNIMKRTCVLLSGAVVLSTAMCGCGHNIAVANKGIGARFAWTPDSMMPEINIGYYEVATGIVKENAEFKYKSAGLTGAEPKDIRGNTTSEVTLKTEKQVTGYTVELEKAK